VARKVANTVLDSRDARRKLKPRGRPYYRAVERGLHIGYRRAGRGVAGAWSARLYLGEGKYEEVQLGIADDTSSSGLDFWQAVGAARSRMTNRVTTAGPFKVKHAVADYLEFLEHNRKTARDVRYRMNVHVLPVLGNIDVAELTADRLRRWHVGLVKQAPRLRTKPGAQQRHRVTAHDDETLRRRRVSANRCLQQLKAALNYAFNDGKVSSDLAWRKVKIFRGAEAARVRYLSIAECKRLLNACEPSFRNLVRTALETGARYGELSRVTVADYNRDSGAVAIRASKTAKPRHVILTADGVSFFEQLVAGRSGSELMLPRPDGLPWRKSHQIRPMLAACKRASIDPPMGFHGLRHCWASHAVMAGLPLLVVAKNLGHADTRMVEKHYGHLAPSYVADVIRKHAPRFGKVPSNVRALP
jgi:integrase